MLWQAGVLFSFYSFCVERGKQICNSWIFFIGATSLVKIINFSVDESRIFSQGKGHGAVLEIGS